MCGNACRAVVVLFLVSVNEVNLR